MVAYIISESSIPLESEQVSTYPVQMKRDLSSGINRCLFAAQLSNASQDANGLVGELLEVGRSDTRGCFGHFGGLMRCLV